jgi:hypothetical protein
MISAIINTVLSVALAGLIVYLLARYSETMIFAERLGYGVGAGMVVLSLSLGLGAGWQSLSAEPASPQQHAAEAHRR